MEYKFYDEDKVYHIVPMAEDVSIKLDEPEGRLICVYGVSGFEEDIYVIKDNTAKRYMAVYECIPGLFTFLKDDNKHILDKIVGMIDAIQDLVEEE